MGRCHNVTNHVYSVTIGTSCNDSCHARNQVHCARNVSRKREKYSILIATAHSSLQVDVLYLVHFGVSLGKHLGFAIDLRDLVHLRLNRCVANLESG
jgi:hypothetical protein